MAGSHQASYLRCGTKDALEQLLAIHVSDKFFFLQKHTGALRNSREERRLPRTSEHLAKLTKIQAFFGRLATKSQHKT